MGLSDSWVSWLTTAAVCAAGFCAVGCSSNYQVEDETLEAVGIAADGAPAWVAGGRAVADGRSDRIHFVGRGIGLNILDESGAHAAARDDAMAQLAAQIGTRVRIRTESTDGDPGPRFLPDEDALDEYRQNMWKSTTLLTDAFVSHMEEDDVYWERWHVAENPRGWFAHPDRNRNRWKCWVLMSISRSDFADAVAFTQEQLDIERVAPAKIIRVSGR